MQRQNVKAANKDFGLTGYNKSVFYDSSMTREQTFNSFIK